MTKINVWIPLKSIGLTIFLCVVFFYFIPIVYHFFILLFDQKTSPLKLKPNLEASIHRAGQYINDACDKNGRFRYLAYPDDREDLSKTYNMLRHAGTIYALATYEKKFPDNRNRRTLRKAVNFLKINAIQPVRNNSIQNKEEMLAIWSIPAITGASQLKAKLGGAGLGLVALLSMEEIEPNTTKLSTLRKLGYFILYMQKADGSFYSRYLPSQNDRDDSWISLYYPGEAALGLIMLFEKDPQPKWINAAAKTILYLADKRKKQFFVEADHWALLASAKLSQYLPLADIDLTKVVLNQHTQKICTQMLLESFASKGFARHPGCLTGLGLTCPTSTRLEGLIASMENDWFQNLDWYYLIEKSVANGIAFIQQSQITNGQLTGGIPRAIKPFLLAPLAFNQRVAEIRIDYVQHALSAMVQYYNFQFSCSNGQSN